LIGPARLASPHSRSPFINADGAYLLACANARKNYIKNNDLIGVVKSYFPSTPYSKYQARFVGAPEVRARPYVRTSVHTRSARHQARARDTHQAGSLTEL
jgi:hypothetical protein